MRKCINFLIKVNGHYIDSNKKQLGVSLNDISKAKIFTRIEMLEYLSISTAKPMDKQYMTDIEIILIEE